MTNKNREQIIKKLLKDCEEIRRTKGWDYTLGSKDVNKNFKSVGKQLGISPEKVLLVYLLKHQDSIISYVKNGSLKGEGVEEKIKDAINYLGILLSLIKE